MSVFLFREPFIRVSPNPGLPVYTDDGRVYYEDFPFQPPKCQSVGFPACTAALVGRQDPTSFPEFTKHTGKFFVALMGGIDHMDAHGVTTLIEDEHYWYGEFIPRVSTKGFCPRVMLRHTTQSGRKSHVDRAAFELAGYVHGRVEWHCEKSYRVPLDAQEFHRCLYELTNVSLAPTLF